MFNEVELKKSLSMIYSKQVETVSELLSKHSPISYFAHVRTYKEGYVFGLTSKAEVFYNSVKESIYEKARYIQRPGVLPDGYNLWIADSNRLTDEEQESRKFMLKHNIDNGLTVVKNSNNHCDYYTFASTPERISVNDFYLNNTDSLNKFINYYHKECKKLLSLIHSKVLREQRVLLPETRSIVFTDDDKQKEFQTLLDKLVNELDFPRLKLTTRQIDVAKHLILGKTNAEIANELGISHRTVEHYIEAMRARLNIKSKSELIIYLLKHIKG